MNNLSHQIQKNLLAIISLIIAISALGYNTYRNEQTEENRNIRSAGFSMLQELSKLQLLVDYAHYDKDPALGNPISGWGRVLYLKDMSYLMSERVVTGTEALTNVWGNEWQTVRDDAGSNQRMTTAITTLRDQVRQTMLLLD